MLEFFSRRKKRKLIVAGCSYVDDYAKSQNLPTFPLWSDLLADKLNMQLINLGKCGAGNKEIYSKIVDAIVTEEKIGLVIPMWSEFQRVSFYVDQLQTWKSFHTDRDYLNAEWTDNFHKGMSGVAPPNPLKKKMPYHIIEERTVGPDLGQDSIDAGILSLIIGFLLVILFMIYKYRAFGLNDIQAATEDSLRMMYGFQTLCENKDIPYLQMQGPFPIMSKSKFDNEKKLTATIINSIFLKEIPKATFLGWPIIKSIGGHCVDDYLTKDEKYVISKEDRHPNAKGHELISELLYEKFKSNYP